MAFFPKIEKGFDQFTQHFISINAKQTAKTRKLNPLVHRTYELDQSDLLIGKVPLQSNPTADKITPAVIIQRSFCCLLREEIKTVPITFPNNAEAIAGKVLRSPSGSNMGVYKCRDESMS